MDRCAAIVGADSATQGIGAWKYDVLGAVDHATEAFHKRDAKVNRLYIFEATVPPRAPEPGLFQQSPRFLDADGKPVRYPDNYMNMYGIPEASPARQGTQVPRGGRGAAAGQGAQAP